MTHTVHPNLIGRYACTRCGHDQYGAHNHQQGCVHCKCAATPGEAGSHVHFPGTERPYVGGRILGPHEMLHHWQRPDPEPEQPARVGRVDALVAALVAEYGADAAEWSAMRSARRVLAAVDAATSTDTRMKVGGPDAVRVTVCESCNRTDRYGTLKARHFAQDVKGYCPGPIREVTYVRMEQS